MSQGMVEVFRGYFRREQRSTELTSFLSVMKTVTLTALTALSWTAEAAPAANFRTSSSDIFIRDEDNRVRFFHGTNFVQKGFPWYPEVLLDSQHIQEMKSWGFNTVRLGVMWSGVEPELGVFNETYIKVIDDILEDCEANGIHALIDVHQDVFSSYFCEYDGAPTWLVDMSTSSEKEFPWPLPGECSDRPWGSNYLAEATGAAFQDMYDNVNGMRDHFSNFWNKVASSFKNKSILGYEIINEPWAGNIYKDPTLLLPGNAGSKNLQPLYDEVQSSIRKADADHIIFYEPVTWGMIFNGTISGSGFTHVPGGKEYADKSVFSFHYYCWWYTNGEGMEKKTCDDRFGPKVFDESVENARALGGSAMLTEWGQGCSPANGMTDECNSIMDMADERLVSWIDWYWQGEMLPTWSPSPEGIATYSRTYAQAVAGIPTEMKYDANSKEFTLCYSADPSITQPTEIYANFDIHYTGGVQVKTSGSIADVKVDESNNKIYVTNAGSDGEMSESTDMTSCVYVSKKA